MSCSKSYFTIILCFFVLFLPEIVSANEKCDFIITKKDLKDLKNGKLYKSVETNGTACLKNYDSRYTYYPIKNGKIEKTRYERFCKIYEELKLKEERKKW